MADPLLIPATHANSDDFPLGGENQLAVRGAPYGKMGESPPRFSMTRSAQPGGDERPLAAPPGEEPLDVMHAPDMTEVGTHEKHCITGLNTTEFLVA